MKAAEIANEISRYPTMDFSCLDHVATQAAFGKLIGVSQKSVSEMKSRGMLRQGQTFRQWLISWAEAFRREAGKQGGSHSTQEALAQARVRECTAKALKIEVETAERLGQLVLASDIEPQLMTWAVRGQQAVESAVERITERIESEFKIELEDKHVRAPLHAVLRELKRFPTTSKSKIGEIS